MATATDQAEMNALLDPRTLAAIGDLEVRARRIVDGLMQGRHRSKMQGQSVEFAQHRPYTTGDDLRFLDWKVAARTDKLHLKQFFKETNLDMAVLVDLSGSMSFQSPEAPWRKFDCAATLAAALAHLGLKQQDRVGLTLFDEDVVDQTRLSNNLSHWRTVLSVLHRAAPMPVEAEKNKRAKLNPDADAVGGASPGMAPNSLSDGRTHLQTLLERGAVGLARKSLVVLISDLFDAPQHLERGLSRLRFRGHDVILLQIMDPAELTFPYRRASEFRGLEGEGRLPLDPAALRKAYLEVLEDHLEAVEETARRMGFDYALLNTADPLGPALAHVLARRNALIRKA